MEISENINATVDRVVAKLNNARIMASVPDLLAQRDALLAACKVSLVAIADVSVAGSMATRNEARKTLRAAIALVEGSAK